MKLIALLLLAAPAFAADAAPKVDFVKDVLPIFKASCLKCHALDAAKPKKKAAAGLRLDDKDAALKGGRSGVALVPGKAEDSLLYKLLKGPVDVTVDGKDDTVDPMPKVKRGEKWKPLPDEQVATIKRWIDEGAAWGVEAPAKKP